MTLLQKLQQYGQFGDSDLLEIRYIMGLAEDVCEAVLDSLDCNCGRICEGTCTHAEAQQLIVRLHALVDGKRRALIGNIDDLWASINFAHGRQDEGDISYGYAKAECDKAIREYLGKPSAEEIVSLFPVEQVDDTSNVMQTPLKGDIDVHEAFVTMTVPVSIAMRVADNELGDSHYDAVCNVEQMLMQDMEEEYGIDTEMAQDYHTSLGCYASRGEVKKNDKPCCLECKRHMTPDECGDELPEERVCDECAGEVK